MISWISGLIEMQSIMLLQQFASLLQEKLLTHVTTLPLNIGAASSKGHPAMGGGKRCLWKALC